MIVVPGTVSPRPVSLHLLFNPLSVPFSLSLSLSLSFCLFSFSSPHIYAYTHINAHSRTEYIDAKAHVHRERLLAAKFRGNFNLPTPLTMYIRAYVRHGTYVSISLRTRVPAAVIHKDSLAYPRFVSLTKYCRSAAC